MILRIPDQRDWPWSFTHASLRISGTKLRPVRTTFSYHFVVLCRSGLVIGLLSKSWEPICGAIVMCEALEQTVELQSADAETLVRRGFDRLRAGQPDRAIEEFDATLR